MERQCFIASPSRFVAVSAEQEVEPIQMPLCLLSLLWPQWQFWVVLSSPRRILQRTINQGPKGTWPVFHWIFSAIYLFFPFEDLFDSLITGVPVLSEIWEILHSRYRVLNMCITVLKGCLISLCLVIGQENKFSRCVKSRTENILIIHIILTVLVQKLSMAQISFSPAH